MELAGTRGPRARRRRRAPAPRPIPSDPGGFVVRDQSAAAPPVASTVAARQHRAAVLEDDADDSGPSGACSAAARAPLEHGDARMPRRRGAERSRTMRRPVALPPACDDPAPRVAALEAERRGRRRRSASKRTPSSSRSRTLSGASSTSTRAADGRTSAAPGDLGVAQVLVGRVVVGERGGQAALRPVAGGRPPAASR